MASDHLGSVTVGMVMSRGILVLATLVVVVVCARCGAKRDDTEAAATVTGPAELLPADGVIVIWARHGDLRRSAPPRESRGGPFFPEPVDERFISLDTHISSSGKGTYQGTEQSPVPIAEVIAPDGRTQMTLLVILASEEGFITRSFLAWSGDYIAGVTVAVRMYDRHSGGKGDVGEMTAELQIGLPGRDDVAFVFVGYNADGQRVPAFGRRPFAESVRAIQEATDEES